MKTVSPDMPSPRTVLFGLRCGFTDAVRSALEDRGLPPSALILPGHPELEHPHRVDNNRPALPIAGAQPARASNRYPTFHIGQLSSRPTQALIESLEPDFIVVACFSHLIPRGIRDIPRFASLNVHPSLLPAHRGPDPLFWILRDGQDGFGVTIHELSDRFDEGDIVAQRTVDVTDGMRESNLVQLLGSAGAELVINSIASFSEGEPRRLKQDDRMATYESWPDIDDYRISERRSARHAWNFIRGVAERGVPIRVETDSDDVLVTDAVKLIPGHVPRVAKGSGEVAIRFSDGWIVAQEHQIKSV